MSEKHSGVDSTVTFTCMSEGQILNERDTDLSLFNTSSMALVK
jgi:hypothetical protein